MKIWTVIHTIDCGIVGVRNFASRKEVDDEMCSARLRLFDDGRLDEERSNDDYVSSLDEVEEYLVFENEICKKVEDVKMKLDKLMETMRTANGIYEEAKENVSKKYEDMKSMYSEKFRSVVYPAMKECMNVVKEMQGGWNRSIAVKLKYQTGDPFTIYFYPDHVHFHPDNRSLYMWFRNSGADYSNSLSIDNNYRYEKWFNELIARWEEFEPEIERQIRDAVVKAYESASKEMLKRSNYIDSMMNAMKGV